MKAKQAVPIEPSSVRVRAGVGTGEPMDFTVNYDQRSDKCAGVQRFMS